MLFSRAFCVYARAAVLSHSGANQIRRGDGELFFNWSDLRRAGLVGQKRQNSGFVVSLPQKRRESPSKMCLTRLLFIFMSNIGILFIQHLILKKSFNKNISG